MENVNGRIKKPSVGECVRGAVDAPPAQERNRPVSLHSSLAESSCFIQDLHWFNDSYTGLGRVSGTTTTEGIPHWELMARNLDANLAELDIDTFRAEDINAVLTLPPICNADFQLQESHRGEMYASVSGSMMARFDLDSSISARSSSMEEEEEEESGSTDMSICRSEPLFSPMREVHPVSFSVDSLDCDALNDQSITITCQANPYNYTIAFQGSFTTTDSESKRNACSGTPTSGASSSGVWDERPLSPTCNQRSLTQSDHPFTTWSKLKRTYEVSREEGNNNSSGAKSYSLPNLNTPLNTVKLFDMQRSNTSRNSDTDKNVSLVKLFMQHRHASSEESGSDWHMNTDSGTGHSDSGTGSGIDAASPLPLDKDKSVSRCSHHCNLNEGTRLSLVDSLMDSGFKRKPVDVIFEEGSPQRSSNNTPQHQSCNSKTSVCSSNSHSCGASCCASCASHGGTHACKKRNLICSKTVSTQVPVHVSNQASQTIYDSFNMAYDSPLKEIKPTHVAKDKRRSVYVCYPNYSLPDLTFLRNKEHLDVNYYLVPQKLRPRASTPQPNSQEYHRSGSKERPFSCDDIEAIKNSSLSHIRDWDSLQTLLPPEIKAILGDMNNGEHSCRTRHRQATPTNNPPSRPHSCDCAHSRSALNFEFRGSDNSIASCQKSSGYKGSSTLLTDSCNPVSPSHEYVYQYESDSDYEAITPNKRFSKLALEKYRKMYEARCGTPLPKGILRKDQCKIHKRLSMQDFRSSERQDRFQKRRSLQDSYDHLSQKIARSLSRESCRATSTSRSRSADSPTKTDTITPEQIKMIDTGSGIFGSLGNRRRGRISRKPLVEGEKKEEPVDAWNGESEQGPLECSSHSYPVFGESDGDDADVSTHRGQVSALLASKGRLDKLAALLGVVNPYGELSPLLNSGTFRSTDNVSGSGCDCHCTCGEAHRAKKTVSFAEKVSVKNGDRHAQASKDDTHLCHCPHHNPQPELRHSQSAPVVCHLSPDSAHVSFDYAQKRALADIVKKSVDKILYQLAGRETCSLVPDASINSEAAQLTFDHLCPALYTLLSDGLSPTITGLFGTVRNSVWKVIESSSQLGPSTKALADLVLWINSEEHLPEGPMKFNAFVAGLLNIQSLSSWLAYLRTRETVLQKHYNPTGFLYLCNTSAREIFDEILNSLNTLGAIKWRLDLLFEYKRLHQSLQLMEQRLLEHDSYSPKDSSPIRRLSVTSPTKAYSEDIRYSFSPKESLSGESAPRATPEQRRPRSLVENSSGFSLQELATSVKKRWSGIHFGSKLINALDRLILEDIPSRSESDDYTDSIENRGPMRKRADSSSTLGDAPDDTLEDNVTQPDPQDSKGAKFRHLQRKWEMISGSSGFRAITTRSRLPRPVTSPTFRLHAEKKLINKETVLRSAKPPVPEKKETTLKRPPMKITLKKDIDKPPTGKQRQTPEDTGKRRLTPDDSSKNRLSPDSNKPSPVDADKSLSPMSLSSSSRSSGSSKCSPQTSTMAGTKRMAVRGTPPNSPRRTLIPRAPRKMATPRQEVATVLKRTPVLARKELAPSLPDDNANSTQHEIKQSPSQQRLARTLSTLEKTSNSSSPPGHRERTSKLYKRSRAHPYSGSRR